MSRHLVITTELNSVANLQAAASGDYV